MKAGAGVAHVLDFICRIQPIQYRLSFGSVFGLYSFAISIVEKIFHAFMDKRFYHGLRCNLDGYACQAKYDR